MHNAEQVAAELAEKLSPRSRHIVLLIGAGAGCAAGLPDTAGLQNAVRDALGDTDREVYNRLVLGRDIEKALTRLRLIAETVRGTEDRVDDISSTAAVDLDQRICAAIAEVIAKKSVKSIAHDNWARWAVRARQDEPLEVFTTNYDLLLERALEEIAAPYFDGFVGTYEGRFRPDLVDSASPPVGVFPPARWIRLWKLHGSISWVRVPGPGRDTVIRRAYQPGETPLAIFPSLQKYDESRRTPFVVLADRLRRSLSVPETLCVTIGYRFGDQHINELLFDAATLYPSSEVIALFRDAAPAEVEAKATSIPNLSVLAASGATIGGRQGEWEAPQSDGPFWASGKFALGEFGMLARFLLLSVGRSERERGEERPHE